MLQERLAAEGLAEDLVNLKVEFKSAGSSSLDLEILADFSGRAAARHEVLSRALQRIAVDACNRYGWVIPFTQLTVHSAPSGPEPPAET